MRQLADKIPYPQRLPLHRRNFGPSRPYVDGGIMIATKHEAAPGTRMYPLGQRLWDYATAAGAPLRSTPGIDQNRRFASFLGFVGCHGNKGGPSSKAFVGVYDLATRLPDVASARVQHSKSPRLRIGKRTIVLQHLGVYPRIAWESALKIRQSVFSVGKRSGLRLCRYHAFRRGRSCTRAAETQASCQSCALFG